MRQITVLFLLLLITFILPEKSCQAEGFNHIWGGFSSSLVLRNRQQRHNTLTAARDIDMLIIMPGETFSFNERVGARDSSKGYSPAPVITSTGLLEDIPGGGICQLASTIYNAGLLAGMEVVERHPHSRVVSHIPPGRDATIASWRKDLKLRNSSDKPLQLRISLNQNRLTASFNSEIEKPFTVEIIVRRTTLLPDTIVSKATTLSKSKMGQNGYSTETRRIIRQNGMIKEELISADYYPAPSRMIAAEEGKTGKGGQK